MRVKIGGITIESDDPKDAILGLIPDASDEQKWQLLRDARDYLLRASDWTQATDANLSPAQKQLWETVRQAWRDLPQTYDIPEKVVFASEPTEAELDDARLADAYLAWFAAHLGIVDVLKKSPDEIEATIQAMTTLDQVKNALAALSVAISFFIKREFRQ